MEAVGEMFIVTPYIEKQEGGFQTQENDKKADTGIIVDIGPDVIVPKVGEKGNLSIGDKVAFNEYAGKNFERDGQKYILMRLQEIYVKL